MRHATYLVRFDDICPTMDWESWDKIEKVLVSEGIKPMLAVVPDNRDKKLQVGQENEHFWSKVRDWQKMGWSIAIHGYQHLYQTNDPGLLGLNKYSEFSGLSYDQQSKKLQKAFKIFKNHEVKPDLWIAPAHSFDKVTVRVLSDLGIEVISDGFFKEPVKHMNMIWIPQQLWKFRQFHTGIWTVCLHINGSNKESLERICTDLIRYSESIVSLDHVLKNSSFNSLSIFDRIFSFIWKSLIKLKRLINRLRS
jgi:predicted deacetylase